MSVLLEGDERLERELTGEPVALSVTLSLLLHLGLAGAIVAYYIVGGFFHANTWGGNTSGGVIHANIVSSAIPLPSDQPPNQNVLSTETPSPAPAPPTPKAAPKIDEQAIPIVGKKKQKPQPLPRHEQKAPQVQPRNTAQYGEQAANNLPRAIQGQTNINGPVSVNEGDFGTRFAWYIGQIQRKMQDNSNMGVVDPRTPKGARAYILFTIHRDGTLSNIQMDRTSGSPTLDRECLRAAQRIDRFDPLPPAYSGNTLLTTYYCEY
jgi:protein TonB